MAEFKGFVSNIIFRNEENGYTVFEITRSGESGDDGDDGGEVTCVGNVLSISVGEGCEVSGEAVTHPVYGEQLKVKSYRVVAPESAEAVYRYLASGAVRGIRKAMAAKIVKRFGGDALRIMEEEPEKLAEIKGISRRKAREIGAQMEEKKDLRDAMVFLQQYGIGNAHAARIWQMYGPGLYEVVKTNPYRLAEDIRGISFATADEIARRVGIRADSEFRIRSGLLYTLAMALGEGHSYLPKQKLAERTCALLRLPPEEVLLQMENLAVEGRLRARRKAEDPGQEAPEVQVYLAGAYRREQEIARIHPSRRRGGLPFTGGRRTPQGFPHPRPVRACRRRTLLPLRIQAVVRWARRGREAQRGPCDVDRQEARDGPFR